MDKLDSQMYYQYKLAIRKAIKNIASDNLVWGQMPIILVDYPSCEVHCFEDEQTAREYIYENHVNGWDEPPSGEDEELKLIKFCPESEVKAFPMACRNYKFFKEINGERIYREKSFVEFEPELIININI